MSLPRLLSFIASHGFAAQIVGDAVAFDVPFTSPLGNGTETYTVRTVKEARLALGY